MSADRIVECPKCHREELREWTELSMYPNGVLELDYRCVCRDCDWFWEYKDGFASSAHSSNIVPNQQEGK